MVNVEMFTSEQREELAFTDEERKQLAKARTMPIAFDEDCTPTTPERALKFHRANPPRQKGAKADNICKAMEDMINEAVMTEKRKSAFRMKAMGLSEEIITTALDVSISLIRQWFEIVTA